MSNVEYIGGIPVIESKNHDKSDSKTFFKAVYHEMIKNGQQKTVPENVIEKLKIDIENE